MKSIGFFLANHRQFWELSITFYETFTFHRFISDYLDNEFCYVEIFDVWKPENASFGWIESFQLNLTIFFCDAVSKHIF